GRERDAARDDEEREHQAHGVTRDSGQIFDCVHDSSPPTSHFSVVGSNGPPENSVGFIVPYCSDAAGEPKVTVRRLIACEDEGVEERPRRPKCATMRALWTEDATCRSLLCAAPRLPTGCTRCWMARTSRSIPANVSA